jgi:hypothetical protein
MFMRRNFSNGGYVIHGATLADYPKSKFSAWFAPDGTMLDSERIDRRTFATAPTGARQRDQLVRRFANRTGEAEFGG